jgi:hypothetical protein
MTVTPEVPAPAAPATARPVAFPLPPEAIVVGGLFRDVEGPLKVMRALRRSGAAGDTVGLAVPLPGDPDDPSTLEQLAERRPKRFSLLGYLKVVIDPHTPPPEYRTLIAGQNSALTRLVLRDLAGWVAGVKTFRIPPTLTGEASKAEATRGGVWVLGRSNHAAAVAGGAGADLGGALGVLTAIGVPSDLVRGYAERIAGGEVLFTTCETDAGRARRDAKWLRKHGVADLFERVIASPRRAR